MAAKRHEVLKRELRETLVKTIQLYNRRMDRFEADTSKGVPAQQFTRENAVRRATSYAVIEHLGYGPLEKIDFEVNRGLDRAIEYFFGDWWKGDRDDEIMLDKSRPDRELRWFDVLTHSMVLAGLTSRWEDLAKICSWLDDSIEAEFQGGLIEDEYQQLFLCIASDLRPEPMQDVDEILQRIKRCRAKRPRLLCAAWEAAVAADQQAFDKAFKQSVEYFLKHDEQNVPNPIFWVALDQSIVWLIAEKNGLQFPELPEKLDAAVVRRQTVGLA